MIDNEDMLSKRLADVRKRLGVINEKNRTFIEEASGGKKVADLAALMGNREESPRVKATREVAESLEQIRAARLKREAAQRAKEKLESVKIESVEELRRVLANDEVNLALVKKNLRERRGTLSGPEGRI